MSDNESKFTASWLNATLRSRSTKFVFNGSNGGGRVEKVVEGGVFGSFASMSSKHVKVALTDAKAAHASTIKRIILTTHKRFFFKMLREQTSTQLVGCHLGSCPVG